MEKLFIKNKKMMEKHNDKFIKINKKNLNTEIKVSIEALITIIIDFLDVYGSRVLLGNNFYQAVNKKNTKTDGKTKFFNLLKASGYDNDPECFFRELLNIIFISGSQNVQIKEICIPIIILTKILEIVIPGKGYVSVRNTDQLENITNIRINENDKKGLQKVIDKYPVRLSRHVIRQILVSENVAYQYMPFVEELDSVGHANTWIGQFQDGLIEQMYKNRVIFLLNMTCPVYCRFCFRKHKEARNEKSPTSMDIKAAVDYVKKIPLIKEILITGGDPFLNRENLNTAIEGLMEIEHVDCLRLATRSIAYYPELFLKNDSEYLKYLQQINHELGQDDKRLELATHFIHPDEISIQSLKIITELVKNGITVYVQTPFLKNCNDNGQELVRLFYLLRGAGAEFHYIFIPCSPIHGNSLYWTPLSKGINIAKHLRANLSDRAMPQICTATPIGKIDWYSSGWAVEKVKGKDDFIWIRTPYTSEFFKKFAPHANTLDNIRLNDEGTFDIQYMARIGEESKFLGSRSIKKSIPSLSAKQEEINFLKKQLSEEKKVSCSIIDTGYQNIKRLHKTRVEIDLKVSFNEIDYIKADRNITDVVIISGKDIIRYLDNLKKLICELRKIDHINSVRLRSMEFNNSLKGFSDFIIDEFGNLNNLSIADPLRFEIETWFVNGEEITEKHAEITRKLNNYGITVYCNSLLLGGVNDTPDKIYDLSYALRKAGIEFHHLYIAGLEIQNNWNLNHPINLNSIIDIASKVRVEGSGREIPRYIILTELGEVDYGLTSSFVAESNDNNSAGGLKVKLDCYDLSYFKSIDNNFVFSEDIVFDNGKPVLNIKGLVKSDDFSV